MDHASDHPEPGEAQTAPPSDEPSNLASESGEPATPAGSDEEPATEAAPATGGGDRAHSKRPRRRRDGALAIAFRRGIPVQGTVEKVIKGGYEVRLGKTRGFCPHSQMDVHHVESPEEQIGQELTFRVIQFRRGGEDVVVSRRAWLEEQRSEEAKAVRATLIEGTVMQGRVARLADFGAFVDLGAGVLGLVHLSELSASHVTKVSDAVKAGDIVQVRILKLDEARGRISLSIRQAKSDPWGSIPERYEIGQSYEGKVLRVADFGSFVEMEEGVEALAPADMFSPSPGGWQESLEVGSSSRWRVVSMEPDRRRMSVMPATDDASESTPTALEPGARVKGKVQRVERFGVFVWLGPGRVGLIPSAFTGAPRGTDLTRRFPTGREVEAEVVEADADGRRIRLSIPGASAPPARRREKTSERRREKQLQGAAPTESASSFGTSLGDLLKAAIRKGTDEP